ncbi:CvfB family protein [Paenibacillus sacheonensis]|uniref:RNA-binding protein n=1 Tax=Paenibacillus sacheonensis TaxID=742054 RepID=A0A7X4YNB5_9BACL|nr:S1-like domain-containing RNA-binding protein [Paenibacillus sacheonensis]MBM7565592.1 putative RNA-binding protein (virulence factor B family) [Paenibacillus sacheonensis]NBC69490.1 RNA-binding protein [Paenibacillus sacheonensis]
MSLIAGTTMNLKLVREVSPYGYFMTDGENEVLLHYTELVGHRPQIGQSYDVFLFFDSEDRIAATMKKPLIQLGQVSRLAVADIHPRIGAFLEMGLGRQLLLPLSEQPELKELRPKRGDEVHVILAHDKIGRLVAKVAFEEELAELAFHAPTSWHNTWVEGWVTKTLKIGSFVMIDGGVLGFGAYGFIPAGDRTRLLRLGERVKARVTFVREDGRVNLSMNQRKEVGRVEDSDRILAFMKERPNGAMPYSDETQADIIKQKFDISKGAFKRALGKLMRDGLVTQDGSWTKLTEQGAASAAEQGEGEASEARASKPAATVPASGSRSSRPAPKPDGSK